MNKTILPLKKIPEVIPLGGDYCLTQSALLLAALSDRQTIIHNIDPGVDTDKTIEFLRSIDLYLERDGLTVKIKGSENLVIPDNSCFAYTGGLYPLSMIMGFLFGFNKSCTLEYSDNINPDAVDKIVEEFNLNGIDVHHLADEKKVLFRGSPKLSMETSLTGSLPHLKNALLSYGLASGRPVTIRERTKTCNFLETALRTFNVEVITHHVKPEWRPDPLDPRRKIRTYDVSFRKEIILPGNQHPAPCEVKIPGDSCLAAAVSTLAVLSHNKITLKNLSSAESNLKFLNLLKSMGFNCNISNKRHEYGFSVFDLKLNPGRTKIKKIPKEKAVEALDNIPFIAILAAAGAETSVIRNIGELETWYINPFAEISRNLNAMGVKCGLLDDGLVIQGKGLIAGGDFGPFRYPQIALGFLVAALVGQEGSGFMGFEIIHENFPDIVPLIDKKAAPVTAGEIDND